MIVDPDFLDHWKTQMLIDTLEDQCAPLYLIRLWGHCQNRKEWRFEGLPPLGVKSICRYQGDAQELEDALTSCGFLSREDGIVTVVGWDERNASLIANWENGSRGGRPKGSANKTDEKPTGSDSDNPSETDKRRVDESGVDSDMHGPQQAESEPSVIDLPTNKHGTQGELYGVSQSQVDLWQEDYPAVSVMSELHKARSWLDSNPAKRKTKQGMKRFLNNWLSRAQDKGGSPQLNGQPQRKQPKDFFG